jgi:hypothetical protein
MFAGNKRLYDAGAAVWTDDKQKSVIIKPREFFSSTLPVDYSDYPPPGALTHFTRECPGPWPGQSRGDYYRGLVEGDASAAHTAFDTLNRILEEKRIRCGMTLIRGSAGVVAFTSAGLCHVHSLMRWRRGLGRWTFQPYGLMVDRKALRDRGARPVVYGDDHVWRRLPARHRYRFQKRRSTAGAWSKEKEWRLPMDLILDGLTEKEMCILVPSGSEAQFIRTTYGWPAAVVRGDPNRS